MGHPDENSGAALRAWGFNEKYLALIFHMGRHARDAQRVDISGHAC